LAISSAVRGRQDRAAGLNAISQNGRPSSIPRLIERSQHDAWLDIVVRADWRNPEDVKASYPNASILRAGRAVFNIKGNDYRLIARVRYQAGILVIRFFGTHAEYDEIDAETV
jgi:mRNA interferase HigB